MKPLFDSPPELSSDLEWLLQNGKASRAALASLLVQEYYSDALRLSWAVLGDLDQARQTVLQAFTAALVNQYRYRSGQNIRIWLFQFLLQVLRKAVRLQDRSHESKDRGGAAPQARLDVFLQPLGEEDRWILFLTVLLGWQTAEAAELAGVEAAHTHRLVEAFRQEDFHPLPSAQPVHAAITLEQGLKDRFPRQTLTEEELADIVARLLHAANQSTSHDLKLVRLWETLLTAVGMILVTGLIWWLNQSLPDGPQQGDRLTPTIRVIRVTRMVLVPVTPTAGAPTSVLTDYTVRPGDTLDSIAHLFGMAVSDLMRLNSLSGNAGLRAGQSLKVLTSPHVRLRGARVATSTPILPPPLTDSSTPQEVIQRLITSQSLWSTLWVDTQLILNGPPGYIGPPDVSYEQLWVDNLGRRSIELSGKSSTRPDRAYAVSGNVGSQIDHETSQRQDFLSSQLIKSDSLRAMVFPLNSDWISSAENLVIGQVKAYIGRQVLLVGVKDSSGFLEAQLWVDVQTGVILRELRFSGDRFQIRSADFSINKIFYNSHFSDGLFNPQDRLAAGFSADASGLVSKLDNSMALPENNPAIQSSPAKLDPPGLDPAQAQLYFRYPENFNTEAASAVIEVFAGEHSLGKTQFGNPWTAICARSSDGWKIAYVSQPLNPENGDTTLHWFDLRNVGQNYSVSEDLAVNDFAFSYDGQNLAFFGRQTGEMRGAVYVFNLLSGALQRLLDRNSATSLVWSPDGNYLAMTSAPSMFGNQEALVVQVRDGKTVARDRYNWLGEASLDPLSPGWPTLDWRYPDGTYVKFPVTMGGLQACSQAPTDG